MNTATRALSGASCLWLMAGLVGLHSGCANPVESDAVAALGPEKAGVGRGPTHRGGEPCLLCHTDGGKANAFSAAGTIYATERSDVPVTNVVVTIFDAAGRTVKKKSNCAGNFYVEEQEGTLTFPLDVAIECTLPDGSVRRSVMGSRIDRDGACSSCHFGNPSLDSPGRVGCDTAMPSPPFVKPTSCDDRGGR